MHDNRRTFSENESTETARLLRQERVAPDDVVGSNGGRSRHARDPSSMGAVSVEITLFNEYVDRFHKCINRINRLDEQHPFLEGQLTYRFTTDESKKEMVNKFADQVNSRLGDDAFVGHQLNEFWGNTNFCKHTKKEILLPLIEQTTKFFREQMQSDPSSDENWRSRRDAATAICAMETYSKTSSVDGKNENGDLANLAALFLSSQGYGEYLNISRSMETSERADIADKIESTKQKGPVDINELGRQIGEAQGNATFNREDIERVDVSLHVWNEQIATKYLSAMRQNGRAVDLVR